MTELLSLSLSLSHTHTHTHTNLGKQEKDSHPLVYSTSLQGRMVFPISQQISYFEALGSMVFTFPTIPLVLGKVLFERHENSCVSCQATEE